MSHRLACTLGLVLAACSGGGDGPAAPDPEPPMIHPIPVDRAGDMTLPRLRRINPHYSN